MKKSKNKISPKWSKASESWLGVKDGRHCHWCRHIDNKTYDGEAHCNNPDSKFFKKGRIRSWNGTGCAEECKCFEIDEWYTKDENYDTTFSKENKCSAQ